MKDCQIEQAIANARASLKIEGLEMTEDFIEIIRKNLKGELSEKEVLEFIKKG